MFRKSNTTQSRAFYLSSVFFILASLCAIYDLLVKKNMLTLSITSLLSPSSHLVNHWHILAVGLVPVYLGLVIFGTGVLSVYCGSALQRWISQHWRNSI